MKMVASYIFLNRALVSQYSDFFFLLQSHLQDSHWMKDASLVTCKRCLAQKRATRIMCDLLVGLASKHLDVSVTTA